MDTAMAARQRTIVERLARSASESGDPSRRPGSLTTTDDERRALVSLIEEMVASDVQLAEVAPSVGALLRSAIAADAVTAVFLDPTLANAGEDAYTPDDLLRIGRVRGQAEASLLAEPMLDASQVARIMGSRSSNPREYARQLRERTAVLALPAGNRFVYPAFQFDERRHALRPLAAEISAQLGANEDPWGVASWWFTVEPVLGARPADLVVDAARDEVLRGAVARELAPIG
jgi:hypothetical protein